MINNNSNNTNQVVRPKDEYLKISLVNQGFVLNTKKKDPLADIPDSEIDKLVQSLEISQQEAIDLWLCDNGYDDDEEQQELDEKASKVHIIKDVAPKKSSKPRKPIEKKVSDEKKSYLKPFMGI